ncbi:MAG: DEAD/DEAH box helicase [Candidatus Jettenia caeni]|nr:DEAD/DEAH box helicase [Candidatus Jettenia caeni]UJS16624.1 MAG: DEAD/DEAH box helicase [Candidatus Jettenia sp.]
MSQNLGPIVNRDGSIYAILREHEEWGIRTVDLVAPPSRLWADQPNAKAIVESGVDCNRVSSSPTPAALLRALPEGDNWTAQTKRSVARLFVHYLICEDPQRRMDARKVITLSHQVSLVQHILENSHLRRVLIADEVGLGKTVEVGLLVKQLMEAKPGLRVLYLAPARLVPNVAREFDRLELNFRLWRASESDARLSDSRIIASIHRAVHSNNYPKILATEPWDVIVVDECHHLSDWAAGGGDPVEKFRLVRELVARQKSDSRLILLSGTPHQGHIHRFDNLLGLLRRQNESSESVAGRVIYRTKEDVQDWNGKPLFPLRQVNEPLVIDLGTSYKQWMKNIHEFYRPAKHSCDGETPRQRAAGWRCAQALQWAASSPQAGLGYLVRQAVRAGWKLEDGHLREAILALRPYRNGPLAESAEELFSRIVKEVSRQVEYGDVEDIEEEDSAKTKISSSQHIQLDSLLREGVVLVQKSPDIKWEFLREKILDSSNGEKVVLFAQPIETVTALARYLEQRTGVKPAIIIGGQSDIERRKEEERFWQKNGPQFLVSSRAGGEGINLQVARRLVHIDVPWNPMELEQRVGRVHRFGSKKTILVDTLVVKDSRERDAYRIARERLRLIASSIVGPERFETIFSRVMCLVSPEELQEVLIGNAIAPLSDEEQQRVSAMVEGGFKAWNEFHEKYSKVQNEIRSQNPGLTDWNDIKRFLEVYIDAKQANGYSLSRFERRNGLIEAVDEAAEVVELPTGHRLILGDVEGALSEGPDGQMVERAGLNLPIIADVLRRCAFPKMTAGAAYLKATESDVIPLRLDKDPCGFLWFLRQVLQAEQQAGWNEQSSNLFCYRIFSNGLVAEVRGAEKATVMRCLNNATPRLRPDVAEEFINSIVHHEQALIQSLRRPSDEQILSGIRYAIIPLIAAVLTQ